MSITSSQTQTLWHSGTAAAAGWKGVVGQLRELLVKAVDVTRIHVVQRLVAGPVLLTCSRALYAPTLQQHISKIIARANRGGKLT